ncbi:MAG: two-component regulator propeller domain-containing protein [Bacteroidia bacterium]
MTQAQGSTPPLRKFHFEKFAPEAGQSTEVINDLHRDRQGLLWMGTYNGLYCFDGIHFKSWKGDPFDRNALHSSVVQGLCEDRNGDLWLATEAGVSRFDRKTFHNYALVDQLSGKEIGYGNWKIICTHKGEVVAETFAGVYIYNPKEDKLVQYPPLRGDSLRFSYVHKNTFTLDTLRNGIWMGTDRGVVFFDLATRTYTDAADHPAGWDESMSRIVVPLTLDRNGRLVFHDRSIESIVSWDPETHRSSHISTNGWYDRREYFATLYFDSQNNAWISTWTPRMYFIDGKTGRPSRFMHDPADPYSSSGAFFWDVWEDSDGTIYLGTTNGLSVNNFSRNFFSILNLPPEVNHRTDYFGPLFIGEDLQGGLWVAPSYQYLLRYDQATGAYRRYDPFNGVEDFENDAHHMSSMAASDDSIFFAGSGGMFVLDLRTDQLQPLTGIPDSIPIPGHNIKRSLLTENGDWWMALHEVGVVRYNIHTHSWRLYRDRSGSANPWSARLISFVNRDRAGNIWIAVDQNGVLRYNPQRDEFDAAPPELRKEMSRYGPASFVEEKNGNVWYNCNAYGVLRYNPKTGQVDQWTSRGSSSATCTTEGSPWCRKGSFGFHFTTNSPSWTWWMAQWKISRSTIAWRT